MAPKKTKALDKTSDEFGTPEYIFDPLDEEFDFTIDVAASNKNFKMSPYWTAADNALKKDWGGERVFCNPPYSRGWVEAFFLKMLVATRDIFILDREDYEYWKDQDVNDPQRPDFADGGRCKLGVLLIPTYTERKWFHRYSQHFETRFFDHRIKFIGGESGARGNHMLLIFRNKDWMWFGR